MFEKWWDEEGQYLIGNKDEAREAWNAAIIRAGDKVAKNFDECEPWIEPGDIYELTA